MQARYIRALDPQNISAGYAFGICVHAKDKGTDLGTAPTFAEANAGLVSAGYEAIEVRPKFEVPARFLPAPQKARK